MDPLPIPGPLRVVTVGADQDLQGLSPKAVPERGRMWTKGRDKMLWQKKVECMQAKLPALPHRRHGLQGPN